MFVSIWFILDLQASLVIDSTPKEFHLSHLLYFLYCLIMLRIKTTLLSYWCEWVDEQYEILAPRSISLLPLLFKHHSGCYWGIDSLYFHIFLFCIWHLFCIYVIISTVILYIHSDQYIYFVPEIKCSLNRSTFSSDHHYGYFATMNCSDRISLGSKADIASSLRLFRSLCESSSHFHVLF